MQLRWFIGFLYRLENVSSKHQLLLSNHATNDNFLVVVVALFSENVSKPEKKLLVSNWEKRDLLYLYFCLIVSVKAGGL